MIRQTSCGLWVIDGDSHISAWVEEKGQLQHDFQTLPLILPLINEGDVVVDVGANIGDTTSPFLERVGATGKVYAFEPMGDAYACLIRNCPDAITYNLALSDEAAFYPFEQLENAGASHVSDKSLLPNVAAATLDSFHLEQLDLFKTDTEGFELYVLMGAEKTIEKHRPIMLVEVNEAALRRQGTNSFELFKWLHNHEYRWWPVVGADLNQGSPQYDILARPITTVQPH